MDSLVPFTLRRSTRSRRVRLSVRVHGEVVVTAPRGVSERTIHAFVATHSEWIKKQHITLAKRLAEKTPLVVPLGGYHAHKARALQRVRSLVALYKPIVGVTVGTIRVRNQTRKWGSCSASGNLSFNFRILFLPEELQHYIVVHELTHRLHMHHRASFWRCVESVLPRYKEALLALRRIHFDP